MRRIIKRIPRFRELEHECIPYRFPLDAACHLAKQVVIWVLLQFFNRLPSDAVIRNPVVLRIAPDALRVNKAKRMDSVLAPAFCGAGPERLRLRDVTRERLVAWPDPADLCPASAPERRRAAPVPLASE